MNRRSAPARVFTLTSMLMTLSLEAGWADGGLLRTRQEAGPFIVSLFTAPELSVGPAEVTVFVQSRDGTVLTDAEVELLVQPVARLHEPRRFRASEDAASNKLAKTAVVDLLSAGEWTVTVTVRFDGKAATATCLLPVGPAPSRLSVSWPWLLVPPGGVLLFAWHQTLKRRRSWVHSVNTHAPRLCAES